MDALEAIFTRRSIRQYEKGEIEDKDLKTILEAGMNAPSAGNAQPWHFIVVDKQGVLDKINELHPNAKMTSQATIGILVCADPDLENYPGNWPHDCSAAVENMLLAIHALGLGAVWVGIHSREGFAKIFRELFGIPESIIPFAFIPIGRPAVRGGRQERYREERVHANKWKV